MSELKQKGYKIYKERDSVFYTFDYTYTGGMNTNKRQGIRIPELVCIGFPVNETAKIIDILAMSIFKQGVPTKNYIVEKIKGYNNLSLLLVEVTELNKLKIEMKRTLRLNKKIDKSGLKKVYQVIISNENSNFDFKDCSGEKNIPLYFDKNSLDFKNIERVTLPEVTEMEHKLLYKNFKFLK